MALVYPFRAFRYNPARVAFDRVLTQPYDKISPALQEKYYAAQRGGGAVLAEAEAAAAPDTEMDHEQGVVHRLWMGAEPQRVAAIQKAIVDEKLVICDGHRRYETALNYRNGLRARSGKIAPD